MIVDLAPLPVRLRVSTSARGLCGVRVTTAEGPPAAPEIQSAFRRYLETGTFDPSFPLDLEWATPFERQVYRTLRKIPPARTITYGQLPGSPRAAARALAGNRLLIAIPCHRVIRADGSIGGFSAGVRIKRLLLEHERRVAGHP